mgnify:CR=1 FL=1
MIYLTYRPRIYKDYQTLIAEECKLDPSERIQAISVLTPNFLHYPMAKLYIIYLGDQTLRLAGGEITVLPITEALKQLPELLFLC